MSNYAKKKSDFKEVTRINTSKFAIKTELVNLKSDLGRLDIGKLRATPVHLSKLSKVVKTDIVKKSVYSELVKKVNAINSSNTDDVIKKILDTSKFAVTLECKRLTETNFNTRIAKAWKNLATKKQ